MHANLTSLLLPYGYVILFLLILLESAGLPLPGETLLVIAAAMAANGRLSIAGVIVAAALGAVLGDIGGYWLGHRGGTALLKRVTGSRYEEHISKGRVFFNRYGAGAVFLARFVPFVRVVAANMAGMSGMPFSKFMMFNSTGGIAWAFMMGSLGYFFGNNLAYLDSLIKRVGIGVVLAVMFIAAAVWIGRKLSVREADFRLWKEKMISKPRIQGLQLRFTNWVSTNRGLVFTLISGLLLAAISGWFFGALSEDVLSRDSLTLYDAGISRWLLSLATEDGSQFFYAITLLGSTGVILTGSLVMGSWLGWRRQWWNLGALVLGVGGGTILNLVLKNIFLRPRPDFASAFYHESGYSFPSGHAMLSVLFYGIFTYVVSNQGIAWKARIRLGTAALTLSILIGFSRIFLGVHYLTDVLGGWSAGIVWLAVCVTSIQALKASRRLPVTHSPSNR